MTILSRQSIRRLCEGERPMITPFVAEKTVVNGKSYGLSGASYDARIAHDLRLEPHQSALAYTVEDFDIPENVVAFVCDKSTYARLFVTAFNTLFDPGFRGNATLELANLGEGTVEIKAGDPICQFVFHWLDEETEAPYRGKYYDQTKEAHGPRFEEREE